MMHTLLYSEMNQAVPGASLSPGHEGGYGGECQVPSPSQWSDPCYSPPSFHSPQHLPVELEKVKEEPFSPPSGNSYLSLPPSPPAPHLSPSSGGAAPHHGSSPYARPASGGHVIKKDAYESCINLADLLNDNHSLMHQHVANGVGSPPLSSSSSYGGGYPDHPLLRGRLEETNLVFHHHHHHQQQKKMAAAASPPPSGGQVYDGHHHSPMSLEEQVASFHKMSPAPSPSSSSSCSSSSSSYKDSSSCSNDGLSFLESLVDVKQEIEDDVSVGSSCGSPAAPSPTGAGGQREVSPVPQVSSCQRDILETVEILAQEHNRRDVQRVSDSLNIPRDPAQWSVEDVRAWLKLQASQLNLPPLMLDFWNYGGPSLLKLTEQQFRQLAPIGGELLYAKLEIWREALRSSPKLSSSSPSSSPNHHQSYTFIHHHQGTTVLPSQDHQHHHLMLTSAHHLHMHQQLQQHQQQQQHQVVHSSGASSPTTLGTAPASPPLPLVPAMTQVPAPVAQVNQQQQQQQSAVAAAQAGQPPSPQQQGSASSSSSSVYLEEPCLDMATLLQQQPASSSSSPKGTTTNTNSPSNNSHCPQPDDAYDSEALCYQEVEEETCTTGGGGGSGRGGTHIHLWQFLKELLQQPQLYGSCIRWLDRQKGVFKIEDSVRVARLWGKRKNRPAMNYDKLSRSIRQYYKKGIMKKTERSQRLVYQFCHPYCL